MQSIFCMGIGTLHKLEDGFSQQRPKEVVITTAEAFKSPTGSYAEMPPSLCQSPLFLRCAMEEKPHY